MNHFPPCPECGWVAPDNAEFIDAVNHVRDNHPDIMEDIIKLISSAARTDPSNN